MCPPLLRTRCAGPPVSTLRWRYVLAAVVSVLALTGIARAGDALTTKERVQLQHSAATIAWPQRATRSVFSRVHPLGIQTLAMEPAHRKDPAAPRRARIYQFDHDRVLARHLVIALDDARVLINQVVSSVHLPLNAAERDWVTMQLLATSWLQDAAEGDLSSLQPSTFVFEPVDPNAHCHVSRCALVSLARADGTVLTVEAVVEFATGVVRPLHATSTSRRP